MWKISEKQIQILEYYRSYIAENGNSPSYQEAGKALNMPPSLVFFHIKKIVEKGLMRISNNGRSVEILKETVKIPLLGKVACGKPIDIFEQCDEFLSVQRDRIGKRENLYALIAQDNSFINIGILKGNYLIVNKQDDVDDGDVAVVVDEDEKATLKRVYKKANSLILKAENDNIPPMIYTRGSIRGKFICSL